RDHERMNLGLRRTLGVAVVLVGITLAAWLVFGSAQDWEGGMRWLRHGLALGSLGMVGFAARLIFPDTQSGLSDTASD
ncbi:hypothetical protein, partial [Streptomyces sp. NL15-2K]|uniref:hypothetical protein n=2 Tax=Streptomyces sp. NL15-2K TaxID=376149 RepID=UPI00209C63DA